MRLNIYALNGSILRLQDVFAYILGVNVKHDGTIMFVCTHNVRCISFENFEEMTKWDDKLKMNLVCKYYIIF